MEVAIGGVGHRALQTRPLHAGTVLALAATRHVNPRSGQLIPERRPFGETAARQGRERQQHDCAGSGYTISMHDVLAHDPDRTWVSTTRIDAHQGEFENAAWVITLPGEMIAFQERSPVPVETRLPSDGQFRNLIPNVLSRRQTTSQRWRLVWVATSANMKRSPTSMPASVMMRAPPGATSSTAHS